MKRRDGRRGHRLGSREEAGKRMADEVVIVKARNDKREYRRIVLDNSLEALLVSDPETEKAAASMAVSVGSFNDPDGLEGVAHFLEHMLFFASEKYPIEDSYSKFITERGGSTNAFTTSDCTNYYFDINADSLKEALDRFAQFFISPLMSADATLREVRAVDSENRKNLLSDSRRMNQLQKHLSSRDHPYHRFSTGNWNTLQVIPKEKGIDIREELIKFYKEHYSSSLMHLVVYGKGSLDEIQTLVEEKFLDVPNTGQASFYFPGHPCSSDVQIVVKTLPIEEGHILNVIWPMTPSIRHYKEGPSLYLGHLIGHEGEGSLFFVLKKLGWAMGLCAGEGDWSYDFSFFNVGIELTDIGHEHVEEIIGLLFKYIHLIKHSGIYQWIFDELVAISNIGFHYQDKVQAINYVPAIAVSMQLYPPEDWLIRSSLPSKFVPETIKTMLDFLTPENMRIFWTSKKFEGSTNSVEPWYGTSYSVESIESSIVQQWIDASPNANLHLPAPNMFIPTDLAIKSTEEKIKFPVMLRKSSYSRLWYKPDTMFFTPKAHILVDFHCPYSSYSPDAYVLTGLFTRLLDDYLNEYAYDAQIAGLSYSICHSVNGFQIVVAGYNHKMRILTEKIIFEMANFSVKTDRFSVIKECVTRGYENVKFLKPYEQALYYSSLMLDDHVWPWNEKLEVLCHLEANDLAEFVPHMFSRTYMECYVAGNLDPSEANSLVQHIESVLLQSPSTACKAVLPSQHSASRTIMLEMGTCFYYPVEVLNPSDENSALVHYIQVHQDDTKMNVMLQLFELVAKQPAFQQLRTVEQLGYVTALYYRYDSGILGLQFLIQSSVKDPAQLNDRVDAFLEMFETKLHDMTNEEYKSNVKALIDAKLEKFKNLAEETSFYWSEIDAGTFNFDRTESEVAVLRELKQQELVDFFNEHIKVDAPLKKSLSVYVYGNLHSTEYDTIKSDSVQKKKRIDDIFSFKKSRPLYGSLKGGSRLMKYEKFPPKPNREDSESASA